MTHLLPLFVLVGIAVAPLGTHADDIWVRLLMPKGERFENALKAAAEAESDRVAARLEKAAAELLSLKPKDPRALMYKEVARSWQGRRRSATSIDCLALIKSDKPFERAQKRVAVFSGQRMNAGDVGCMVPMLEYIRTRTEGEAKEQAEWSLVELYLGAGQVERAAAIAQTIPRVKATLYSLVLRGELALLRGKPIDDLVKHAKTLGTRHSSSGATAEWTPSRNKSPRRAAYFDVLGDRKEARRRWCSVYGEPWRSYALSRCPRIKRPAKPKKRPYQRHR